MLLIPQKPLEARYMSSWQVNLPLPVYREMMHYVEKFDTECSGCGMVEMTEKAGHFTFEITEVFLPEQKNTQVTTDIDAGVVSRVVTKLVRDGRPVEKLRFHWHSHVNMSVFHSGTDTDNYSTLDNGEWLVSLVLNKKGEAFASVHYYKPFKLDAFNVPLYVTMADSVADPTWDANIARVHKYQEDERKKPVTEYFHKGRERRVLAEDDDPYGRRDWQKVNDEQQALAMETLEIMTFNEEFVLLGGIERIWTRDAGCRVINLATGRILKLQLECEDKGMATERDFTEAQYNDTTSEV